MSRLPLRLRVTLGFAVAMALLLGALGAFVLVRFSDRFDESIDEALGTRLVDLANAVRTDPSRLRETSGSALAEPEDGYAQLLNRRGEIVDSTAQLGEQAILSPAQVDEVLDGSAEVTGFERQSLPGIEGPSRGLARRVDVEGRERALVVGVSLGDRDEAASALAYTLAIGGLAALALASLAGYLAAGAALKPVEDIRRRAESISAEELDERLPLPAAEDEIRDLGRTLNTMLDRLAAGIERERSFVDDASHELRTPLALQKTELELALRYAREPEDLRRAIRSAIAEVDRLSRLAEDMLVAARTRGGELSVESEPVDLAELLERIRLRFAARAVDERRRLTVVAPNDLGVLADPVRLGQALSNLVDNALRHGSGEVELSADREMTDGASRVVIRVRDRGEGFPHGFRDRAFERFSQADEARGDSGTGLGLAIVSAIARAHGGSAGADNRPGGGAETWIAIPS
ncbi:HAMP domain-containing protein [Thermoleophilia bacterium SCSIO 60948]|nr:HAMP domain-containing protein [Thermoleophilia bacterium SCSIO 60948]